MVSDKQLTEKLQDVLEQIDLKGLGEAIRGKVRDSYLCDGKRIMITSDRLSAFDCIIGTIPLKGQVLTQIAAFWFEKTADIVPSHLIEVPDPNVMVVAECEQLKLEFVVRGYITGVTKTSAWYNYEKGIRNFCGNALPEGLRKNQKLESPILTPTTKLEKHDRPVSREEAISEGLIDAETFDKAAGICFSLFQRGQEHAASRGMILVDTKYELGIRDGELVVSDEIHTPDSSRYWYADTYDDLFRSGKEQRQLDKEYVRQWLSDQGFTGEGNPPALTEEVRKEAARRYIAAYEVITGRDLEITSEPIGQRIESALRSRGYIA
ncbi:MAG: phosphoribosylaminoimidazolesuccinocarboxamide synthase [Lentisphaerales bacterium]|jgi:phosphoribosylaminoimidazole-succinocarboxamide synthase|nr:MAG: phosphoribosylaminoimidazolesuccinocarboxamide synthase [Lentisphaerales bacterium]